KTSEKITVANANKLLGNKTSAGKGFRLDGTTLQNPAEANTNKVNYSVESIPEVPKDMELNPYGIILLTEDEIKINLVKAVI
ncbi:MAG: hypothetical protein LBH61_07865, partial [Dysgonamonadaceae bacterium]|nr:hypothetical protein [Dysgonamonadaceae bacterium]